MNGWTNFYVIVGSSAGALIGLQFVVRPLIAGRPTARGEAQAGDAFSTPSVVHFGVVLLLSAIVSAPWDGAGTLAVLRVGAAREFARLLESQVRGPGVQGFLLSVSGLKCGLRVCLRSGG